MIGENLTSDQRVVISGAGPTGMGAGLRLKELKHANFAIYDQADQVGGLATSYTDAQGFVWDIGGHVQFSHYRYFDRLMDAVLGSNWLEHERDDLSWGPNNTFRFPMHGGTGAIWEGVANLVGREYFTLNKTVTGVDPGVKTVLFSDGTTENYDVLISTLPIDRLTDLCGWNSLQATAEKLKYSTSNIIGVGLSGKPPETLQKKCWMYFLEGNCPFYRVTVFSNYSPNNVPNISRQWSLMAEVSESSQKPVDQEQLVEDVIEGMFATNLIQKHHDVLSTWSYRAHYGYPTPALGRDEALNALHPKLEQHDIYSRGRFGGWKYEVSNQDHSLMQGVELADRLVNGTPEVTYWFPGTAHNMAYAKSR